MSQNTVQAMSTDDFLAHYGVKGMKWGVRKSDSGGGEKSDKRVIAGIAAKQATVAGAIFVGRSLGASAGTSVAGPGIGTLAGSYVDSYAAGKVTVKAMRIDEKKAAAKKDIAAFLPEKHASYKDGAVKNDIQSWGPDGAKRINSSLNAGMKLKDAREKEFKLQRTASLIAGGAVVAAYITKSAVKYYGPNGPGNASLHNFAQQKGDARRARGAAREAARSMPSRNLNAGLKVARRGRGGAFNVTSMR